MEDLSRERRVAATGTPEGVLVAVLTTLLSGSTRAAAIMPWRWPGPISLPISTEDRLRLVQAHIRGSEATVWYCPEGQRAQELVVPQLVLSALCPASDGRCRWAGFDLDHADGHGAGGLRDPVRVMQAIAERADALGLYGGVLAARSRSGRGRHVWLIPPEPMSVADTVAVLAALTAISYQTAHADVEDSGGEVPNAFTCGDGSMAAPGKSGAVELIPRGTERPRIGWSLTLPAAGAFASGGGGVLVDPLTDKPITLSSVPACDSGAWRSLLQSVRARLDPQSARPRIHRRSSAGISCPRRVHPRTTVMLAGRVNPGERNLSLFASTCNLLGCGVPPSEAEERMMQAGLATNLSEREVRATIKSAMRRMGVCS